jgi:hypothetical protein
LPVVDLSVIRPGVVGALEDALKIHKQRRIAGEQRDGNFRQGFVEPDRVDEEIFQVVEAVNRDVVLLSYPTRKPGVEGAVLPIFDILGTAATCKNKEEKRAIAPPFGGRDSLS